MLAFVGLAWLHCANLTLVKEELWYETLNMDKILQKHGPMIVQIIENYWIFQGNLFMALQEGSVKKSNIFLVVTAKIKQK